MGGKNIKNWYQTVQKNLENYEKSLVEKVSDMQDELE